MVGVVLEGVVLVGVVLAGEMGGEVWSLAAVWPRVFFNCSPPSSCSPSCRHRDSQEDWGVHRALPREHRPLVDHISIVSHHATPSSCYPSSCYPSSCYPLLMLPPPHATPSSCYPLLMLPPPHATPPHATPPHATPPHATPPHATPSHPTTTSPTNSNPLLHAPFPTNSRN